jgi:lipopolysaccharide transport system ATP-binding protein
MRETFAIQAHRLGKQYRLGQVESGLKRIRRRLRGQPAPGNIWAVDDMSFEIDEGDTVGLIGRNGAGKSTLLKLLSRVTEPTTGYADVAGRVASLLEVGTGMSGELTGRENIYLNGAILGMSRREVDRKFDEIVAFSGVERHIDTPVKWYSSGMFIRLAFAVAAHLEPEILIVDEVLSVGDAEFQKRCLGRMGDVAKEGRTVLFVSHNMQVVRRLCKKGMLLEGGKLVDEGDIEGVIRRYLASIDLEDAGMRRWTDEPLGDETCRILSATVTDDTGESSTTFFSSRPIYLTIEFELTEVNPALIAGIEVATVDGVAVFSSHFRDMPERTAPRLVSGLNALRCTIPSDLLNSGRYVVNLRFSLQNVKWIAYEDAILHFDLIADHGESLYLISGGRSGVIAPALEWVAVEPGAVDGSRVAVRAR